MVEKLMKWCVLLMVFPGLALPGAMAQDLDDNSILASQDVELEAALSGDITDAEADIIGELDLEEPVLEPEAVPEPPAEEPDLAELDLGAVEGGGSDVEDLTLEALGGEDAAPEPPAVEELSLEELTLDEPAVEPIKNPDPEPVVEVPVVEEPAIEAPVLEAPGLDALVLEAPAVEAPIAEAPAVEVPVVEEPGLDALLLEEPAVVEPAVEAPVVEAPVVEEPVVEEPGLDALVLEEPVVEAPVVEEPAVDPPVVEEPGLDALVLEEPVVEAPVVEEPVVEAPGLDALVLEEPVLPGDAEPLPVIEEPGLPGLDIEEPGLPGLDIEEPGLPDLGALEEPVLPGMDPPPVVEEPGLPDLDGLGMEDPLDAAPVADPDPVPVPEPDPLDAMAGELGPEGAPPVVEDDLDNAIADAVREAIAEGVPEIPPTDPRQRRVLNMMGREQQLRKAYEDHALQLLIEGERAFLARDYVGAITAFQEADVAYKDAGVRPQTLPQRERVRVGLGRALYARALDLRSERTKESVEEAREKATKAANLGHERSPNLVAEMELWLSDGIPQLKPPDPARVIDTPENKRREEDVRLLLRKGRQYFAVGRYTEAQEQFERVLKRDPVNSEAIRWRNKISHVRYDRSSEELESTRTDMMAMVRDTWNPRSYGLTEVRTTAVVPKSISRTEDDRRKILNKMEKIVIPEVNFRLANIQDVIEVLVEESQINDNVALAGEKKGVDIVLNLGEAEAGGAVGGGGEAAEADPFADAGGGGGDPFGGFGDAGDAGDAGDGGGGGGPAGIPLITFRARKISLLEALKLVTKVANLKYRVEGSVVMVVKKDAPEGEIITRMYNVLPNVGERIDTTRAEVGGGDAGGGGDFITMGEGGVSGGEYADWKNFFSELGVPWPAGSTIKHLPSLGKIVVANTADNLTVFEQVLNQLNVVPYQITIEARFVEVQQTDLDTLGFQWLLTDDWEIAQQEGSGVLPMSSRPRVTMRNNRSNGGFTSGQRFMNSSTAGLPGIAAAVPDNIMTISSILTNPELTFVLHALQQSGHADVLSAPKVTAQAGTEATIKVVTEYIYPTDFTVQPIMGRDAGGQSTIVGGIVEPSSFETREVGVILSVLPEVSPEGQMINLTMTPEVVTEPTWRNYGSEYSRTLPDGTQETQQLPMEQPFFHTRSVSTSISIYNGATVVMGGMITEQRTDTDDSIPILGSIPIIGRLFRSKIEHSEKRNLLIFVTAKLVDPAGKTLDSDSSVGTSQPVSATPAP